ncbi:MAG: protein kinase [Mobilitalea sp.]
MCFKSSSPRGEEKKARFKDEIKIMISHYKQVAGIMPIIDYSYEELWYVMPLAKPIISHIEEKNLDLNKIIQLAINYAFVLAEIHSKGISHRDIKPLNLYILDNKCVFGDFGLADFPESENDFTRSDRGLGAIFTIAPEMKRNPKTADGKKADVFSFAKTIWMLLTLDEKGFDGPYVNNDSSFSLRYKDKYRAEHLVELERLLKDATDNDPIKRPNMEEFITRLVEYQTILNDKMLSQESDWKFLSNALFGSFEPKSIEWTDTNVIVKIINEICSCNAYNHMMFPDGGGNDLKCAEIAAEEGCIYIYEKTGGCSLVRPQFLRYESFGENFTWNFFWLEAAELHPILLEEHVRTGRNGVRRETVVEDYPKHYVSADYVQYEVYDYDSGEKLPKGFKLLMRYLGGRFLIVMKFGAYNRISATYDGRHMLVDCQRFRKYLEEMIQYETIAKEENKNPEAVLGHYFYDNIFEPKNSKIEKNVIEKSDLTKAKSIISKGFYSWKIPLIDEKTENRKAVVEFYFEFKPSGGYLHNFLMEEKWYLSKEGFFYKSLPEKSNNLYTLIDREDSIKMAEKIMEVIKEKCKEGCNEPLQLKSYVNIHMRRIGKPTHLFTKEELEKEMRDADDRYNNKAVIDEYGFVKILKDSNTGYLYPVQNESWNAGNKYVGKYADLSDIDEVYCNLLLAWRDYLQTDRSEYLDYYQKVNDLDELIKEIKTYM